MYYNDCVWARASHGKVEGQWKDYVGVCSASTMTYLCKPHLLYRPFFFSNLHLYVPEHVSRTKTGSHCDSIVRGAWTNENRSI